MNLAMMNMKKRVIMLSLFCMTIAIYSQLSYASNVDLFAVEDVKFRTEKGSIKFRKIAGQTFEATNESKEQIKVVSIFLGNDIKGYGELKWFDNKEIMPGNSYSFNITDNWNYCDPSDLHSYPSRIIFLVNKGKNFELESRKEQIQLVTENDLISEDNIDLTSLVNVSNLAVKHDDAEEEGVAIVAVNNKDSTSSDFIKKIKAVGYVVGVSSIKAIDKDLAKKFLDLKGILKVVQQNPMYKRVLALPVTYIVVHDVTNLLSQDNSIIDNVVRLNGALPITKIASQTLDAGAKAIAPDIYQMVTVGCTNAELTKKLEKYNNEMLQEANRNNQELPVVRGRPYAYLAGFICDFGAAQIKDKVIDFLKYLSYFDPDFLTNNKELFAALIKTPLKTGCLCIFYSADLRSALLCFLSAVPSELAIELSIGYNADKNQ